MATLKEKRGVIMRLPCAILVYAILIAMTTASAHVEDGQVYYTDRNGTGVTRLSSGTGSIMGPAWSPDGGEIFYLATDEGHEGPQIHHRENAWIRMVRLPGLEARLLELPTGVLGARSPAWKPDGTQVAFVGWETTAPDAGHNDIYLMNLSDGTTANLTNGSIPFITMLAWSPDGRQIAFTAGIGDEWSLYVLSADGQSAADRVVTLDGFLLNPTWSPDGSRFAVQYRLQENYEICVLNADGSGLVNLSDHPAFDGDPTWNPDGTEIAFVSNRDGNLEIYCMAADGSGVRRVTVSEGKDVEPAWSPDGGKICFVSDREVQEPEATAP